MWITNTHRLTDTYSFVRSCVLIHDPVWFYRVLYGPIWFWQGLCGLVRSCLVLCDPVWSIMVLCGPVWPCIVLNCVVGWYIVLYGFVRSMVQYSLEYSVVLSGAACSCAGLYVLVLFCRAVYDISWSCSFLNGYDPVWPCLVLNKYWGPVSRTNSLKHSAI